MTYNNTGSFEFIRQAQHHVDQEEAPLAAVHRRRGSRVGKSLQPAPGPGNFEIVLSYKNTGSMVQENACLSDVVPAGFTLNHSSHLCFQAPSEGKTLLKWNLGRVEPGTEIEVVYQVHGAGSFKPSPIH